MDSPLDTIINTTFPSICSSDITPEGKIDMYNLYLKKGCQYINNSEDFQRLSRAYQKYK